LDSQIGKNNLVEQPIPWKMEIDFHGYSPEVVLVLIQRSKP